MCVSGFPTIPRFLPDPKHFIVNYEPNVVKFAEKMGGDVLKKCNFYIKYFDKIKCYADRPYLVFSELKPETHIYLFLASGKFFFYSPCNIFQNHALCVACYMTHLKINNLVNI